MHTRYLYTAVNVRLIRGLSGRSQEWTAQRLKIGRDRLGRIERGELQPDLAFARAFCKVFGCALKAVFRPATETEVVLKDAGFQVDTAKAFKAVN